MRLSLPVAGTLGLLAGVTNAIQVNFNSDDSIKSAASTVAFGLLKYYTGNNTGDVPGNLPDPYFWWEAGAMFGTMVDYWFYTGDTTYNEVTSQALVHQAGDDRDFMPTNQTRSEGNDDQGFWAMAAMSAAENNYPDPPPDQPQWLGLAQGVFNEYVGRWDESTCGGGLRWQIFTFNNGFNYKNSISNGCFFNIAARLARFTGNQTYADWADKIYDWMEKTDLISPEGQVFDGASTDDGCKKIDKAEWTYNLGIFVHGSAVMYNHTGGGDNKNNKWKPRVQAFLDHTAQFHFLDGIIVERPCEENNLCDFDQRSFKGYLTRYLAATMQLAPFSFDQVAPLLKSTAAAAAQQCSGSPPAAQFKGIPGTACGFSWAKKDAFDGSVGVGEQMSALQALQYTLVKKTTRAAVTADTGGTSKGDPNAGISVQAKMPQIKPITTQDQVAAGFITTAVTLSLLAACVFVVKEG
ncbi:hypothetical protein PG985_013386 [Apiospora marii]|uniref:Mannan endo-1,6-alpha-mannosidase n=1 Tax=Apiospora marii TaxID=335849 RepID=A0ABR1R7Y1_9PEZI